MNDQECTVSKVCMNETLELAIEHGKILVHKSRLHEKVKEYEENYQDLADRFNHLAKKHREVKAANMQMQHEVDEVDNLNKIIESLKERCLKYESDMAGHPDFEGYFKKVEIESDESIIKRLGLPADLPSPPETSSYNKVGVDAPKFTGIEASLEPVYDGDQ